MQLKLPAKLNRTWIAAGVAGAVAVGLAFYVSASGPATSAIYETRAADRGPIQKTVQATGTVRAVVTVDVSSQLSGQISEVKVDYNSIVKAGDLLATIDPKSFQTRVASAEANLQVAQANVTVRKAGVVKAQAVLADAQRILERQKQLAEKGFVSQAALDTARTTVATAKADVEVAKAQLLDAEAVVTQRRADVEEARIDVTRTEIRSPIDGIVIARNVAPGATVAASLSAPILFQIAQDLSQIQIEVQVDEADIGAIKAANTVTFAVDAYPDRTFEGRVAQVRMAATELQNVVTYMVIVYADNPRSLLLPGMTANVSIVTGSRGAVLRVANEAARFQPVVDSSDDEDGGGRRGGGGGGGRNAQQIAELTEKLSLTPEQVDTLTRALQTRRGGQGGGQGGGGQGGGGGGGGGGPSAGAGGGGGGQTAGGGGGQRRRSGQGGAGRLDQVIRPLLTAEQLPLYEAWRAADAAENEGTRRGTVYVLNDSGEIEPRRVRFGLSDTSNVEIVDGELQEGEQVVLRLKTVRPTS